MDRIWELWKWEFKKNIRAIILSQITVMAVTFFAFLAYRLAKMELISLMLQIKQLPEELYAFLGIGPLTEVGNQNFYIIFFAALAGVFYLAAAMKRMAESIYSDERNGMAALFVNQWYSRSELLIAKYLWNIAVFLAGIVLWTLEIVLLVLLGSVNGAQAGVGLDRTVHLMLWLFLTGFLFINLICCLAVSARNGRRIDAGGWSALLIGGSLLIGSLYKISAALGWLFRILEKDDAVFTKLAGAFRHLYWLSPISWQNPFAESDPKKGLVQFLICIMMSAVLAFLSWERFSKRKIIS